MARYVSEPLHLQASAPATRGLLYGDLRLDLLLLYFLTGIFANYPLLYLVNNGILVVFLLLTLGGTRLGAFSLSPLIVGYGMLTALSLFNGLRLIPETGGLPAAARTMPIILLTMVACRTCARPGLFNRSVVLNVLPLAILLPLGGVQIAWGRFSNAYLNEYMHGFLPQFAFAVGLVAILNKRFEPLTLITFVAACGFMAVGASRRYFLFVSLALLVAFASRRTLSPRRFLVAGIILALALGYLLPRMTASQKRRMGDESFTWSRHIERIVSGEATDRSSVQRLGLIRVAVRGVRDKWLGFGHGNFPHVVYRYNQGIVEGVPGHPHSGLAEALTIGGYPGLALYLGILAYLLRIGWRDPVMRICLVWVLLQVFLAAPFGDKVLWPLLAIAEHETRLEMPSLRYRSATPEERARMLEPDRCI